MILFLSLSESTFYRTYTFVNKFRFQRCGKEKIFFYPWSFEGYFQDRLIIGHLQEEQRILYLLLIQDTRTNNYLFIAMFLLMYTIHVEI